MTNSFKNMSLTKDLQRIRDVMGFRITENVKNQSENPMQKYIDSECIKGGQAVKIIINGKELFAVKKMSVKIPGREFYYLIDFRFGYFDENDKTKFIVMPDVWDCKGQTNPPENVVQNIRFSGITYIPDNPFFKSIYETDDGIELVTGYNSVEEPPYRPQYFLEKDNIVIPFRRDNLRVKSLDPASVYYDTQSLNKGIKDLYRHLMENPEDIMTRLMTSDEFRTKGVSYVYAVPRLDEVRKKMLEEVGLYQNYYDNLKSIGKVKLKPKTKKIMDLAEKKYNQSLIDHVKKHNYNEMFLGKEERKRYRELNK